MVLSALAVFIIGGYMSFSVGTNLFDCASGQPRRALGERRRSPASACFDEAAEQVGSEDLDVDDGTMPSRRSLSAATTHGRAPSSRSCASPGQDGPEHAVRHPLAGRSTSTASSLTNCARQCRRRAEPRTHSQSVALTVGERIVQPGLVVGLDARHPRRAVRAVPRLQHQRHRSRPSDSCSRPSCSAGSPSSCSSAPSPSSSCGSSSGPVQLAAETSEKLAAGELEVRIPVKGDDVIATLARSFNGMAASLQNQITRLAALSQVQQRFVSDVSHELRTPLTTIRLAGDVLYDQRESFPPATARTAELLHTQVERFELLLADLLEMSRYDAGAVDMETEPTNLVRLVEDADRGSARRSPSRRAPSCAWSRPGGYFEAEVDARRIRRIMQNLLGNAIDHGEGKPIVDLGRQRRGRRRDRGARLRCRHDRCRHGARVRPVLASRPVPPAHHGRHRTRARDLARGRRAARRLARGLVSAGRGLVLPAHPAARARRRAARRRRSSCRRRRRRPSTGGADA